MILGLDPDPASDFQPFGDSDAVQLKSGIVTPLQSQLLNQFKV